MLETAPTTAPAPTYGLDDAPVLTDEPVLFGFTAAEIDERVAASRPRWILHTREVEAQYRWTPTKS